MKKKKQLMVNCSNCKSRFELREVKSRYVGYKDVIDYYTVCKKCGKQIIIQEKDVPKVLRNKIFSQG